MKRLLIAAVLFLAPAGSAHAAAPVTMVVRDVVPQPARSLASATPRFNMVGLRWRGGGTPWFRTRSGGGWSAWQQGGDDPVWTGPSRSIQVRTVGRITRLREFLLWSPPVAIPDRRLQMAGSPVIVSRSQWHADESIRRGRPRYAPTLQLAVVHHTATANAYSCANSAQIVRGIEVFHVKGNGWDDIGYNFLVDACGRVFEGRYGGIDKNVIGAHSGGFNTGTVGVSLIGNFTTLTPSKAQQDALVNLLAWRLDIAHVDPLSLVSYRSGGNSKFPAGKQVTLRAVSGHRDTYLTSCPGNALYRLLPGIAARVAQTGLPKLYSPVVTGAIGGPIRFTARLTASLPWTVSVADPAGVVVATGTGTGKYLDWTWDSTLASPSVAYTWVISAGATVRGAVGVLGGKLAALTLTDVRVTPAIFDGFVVPTATVSYTLSSAAIVTAELIGPGGTTVTLFSEAKSAGPQSFPFTPTGLPDGNYAIRITARDVLARQSQATATVALSHSLLSFAADTAIVSPNGDGRRDSAVFSFMLAQPTAVTLTLDTPVFSFPLLSAELSPGLQTFAFTGAASTSAFVPDGTYQAKLAVGGVTATLPLTVDRVPPTISLVSLSPLRVRVAERVTVVATVNGRSFKASAAPGVVTLAKKEQVKTLRIVARDVAGNESLPIIYPLARS